MKLSKLYLALPVARMMCQPDLLLALAVASVAGMLIVPVPTILIDLLIPMNIALSVLVLLVALFARRALQLSSFPSLLLMCTLFRLALNVSTTRGILTHADAGALVKAFGDFVVRGDVVIGAVMFLVITIVQFLVVSKGAERVAEVGARFTLDAMPGKQMSIDAALRAGALEEDEAQIKRDELDRASMLFGNMDGAMKFVKGDTIAGLIITAINIVAGVIIGTTRMDMTLVGALDLYATLTVGDGLVAQVSALLIALAAGILVTRVEPEEDDNSLGGVLAEELLSNEKVLFIGGGLMGTLALIPGLPALPFLLCAAAAFLAGLYAAGVVPGAVQLGPQDGTQARQTAFKQMIEQRIEQTKKQRSITDQLAPTVVPIGIDLDPGLTAALGFDMQSVGEEPELIGTYIPQLRDALYAETGVRFPGVRVRSDVRSLPKNTFVIRIDDVPVVQERLTPGTLIATAPPARIERLGVPVTGLVHPMSRALMSMIAAEDREVVEACGVNVWDLSGALTLYLIASLRRRAKDFVGLQEVADTVDRLEKAYPALVREVVPKVVGLHQLVKVLKRLVEEGVSIRNMRRIVEALGEFGAFSDDTVFLAEQVRAALSAQLAHAYAGLGRPLSVVLLDPVIEDTVAAGITATTGGTMLALEPEVCNELVTAIAAALQPAVEKGERPVLLTTQGIRRYVRKLLEVDLPTVSVLSYDELPSDLTIQPMGRACLAD